MQRKIVCLVLSDFRLSEHQQVHIEQINVFMD